MRRCHKWHLAEDCWRYEVKHGMQFSCHFCPSCRRQMGLTPAWLHSNPIQCWFLTTVPSSPGCLKIFQTCYKKMAHFPFFAAQWRPRMPIHIYCRPWSQCHTFCPVSIDPDGAGLNRTPSQLCVNPAQSCLWIKEWKEVKGNRKKESRQHDKNCVVCRARYMLKLKKLQPKNLVKRGLKESQFFIFNVVNVFYFICIIRVFWPAEVCLAEYYWM